MIEERECRNCGDRVLYLSSDDLCDGCVLDPTITRGWNTDKPHRCPACHAVYIDHKRPSSWAIYTCCGCGVNITRWPRLAFLLPNRGVVCIFHREIEETS